MFLHVIIFLVDLAIKDVEQKKYMIYVGEIYGLVFEVLFPLEEQGRQLLLYFLLKSNSIVG